MLPQAVRGRKGIIRLTPQQTIGSEGTVSDLSETGAPETSGIRNRLRQKRGGSGHQEVVHRAGNVVSVAVGHELPRPVDDGPAWRPDAEERAFVWGGEPPSFDEAAVRATYDLNKELANDLRRNVTIVVGSPYIRTSSHLLFRRKIKKRR
jgi:hypothetical protein